MNPDNLIAENLSLLKRFKNPDIRQEAFFGLRDAAIKFDPSKSKGNFIAFANQHIRWKIMDYYRRLSFIPRTSKSQAKLFFSDEIEVFKHLDPISNHKHFHELISSFPLSDEDKNILIFYFEKDFTFEQIGEVFDLTESGVYYRFKRIMKTLRLSSRVKKEIERRTQCSINYSKSF